MIGCNFPLFKIDLTSFNKYCNRRVKTASHYRINVLPKMTSKCDENIRDILKTRFIL